MPACGGLGFVIGLIVYFGWRNSEKQWQKVIAQICGVAMVLSVGLYALAFCAYSF
jgi:hypothetical protein